MRYLLLIGRDDKSPPPPSPDNGMAIVQAHMRVSKELSDAGKMVVSERLRPETEGTRVRSKAGQVQVTDGPFAETKELVAGFWLWEAKSMEEAIAWVKRCPNPMPGDSDIEIRPLYEAEDFAPK